MTTPLKNPSEMGVCCDLCGGDEFQMLHEWAADDSWNPASIPIAVWRCEQCDLVILHPVPTAQQLPAEGDWWSEDRQRFKRRRWFKTRWARLRHAIVGSPDYRIMQATRKAMPTGRLLDVGCGCGELMTEARRYYDCVGIEPSAAAVEIARQKGLQVLQGTFEDVEVEPGSFDVVTLDAVIEHVISPTQVLAKINNALRIGGVVVLTTPKFGGPAYQRHGPAWNGFRHGYHTYLFTGDTLGKFMEKAGFEVLAHPRRDRAWDDKLQLWGRKIRESQVHLLPGFKTAAA